MAEVSFPMPINARGMLGSKLCKAALAALLTLTQVALWSHNITGSLIQRDAAENLQLALNLRHHGVYSAEAQAPYTPSIIREPVPVLTIAVAVAAVDHWMGPGDNGSYFQGQRARLIKLQNIFWMALLSAAMFTSVYLFSASYYLSLLAVLLVGKVPFVNASLVYWHLRIDSLYTELPAAALFVVACTLMGLAHRRRGWASSLGAGLVFGLLALTKAAFLYVFAVLALILVVLTWRSGVPKAHQTPSALPGWPALALMCAAFASVVAPWMLRDHTQVGTYQITDRGGSSLHLRAVTDGMSNSEMAATLYWWAPDPVSHWIFGRILHLSDTDFVSRSSLMRRLNNLESAEFFRDDELASTTGHPESAVSYFYKALGQERKWLLEARASGTAQPDLTMDKVAMADAQALMRAHPLRNLLMSVLFLYRAAWYWFFGLLAVGIYGWRHHRMDLAIMTLPMMLMIAFYALVSDFILRYAAPVMPAALSLILIAGYDLWMSRAKNETGIEHEVNAHARK